MRFEIVTSPEFYSVPSHPCLESFIRQTSSHAALPTAPPEDAPAGEIRMVIKGALRPDLNVFEERGEDEEAPAGPG